MGEDVLEIAHCRDEITEGGKQPIVHITILRTDLPQRRLSSFGGRDLRRNRRHGLLLGLADTQLREPPIVLAALAHALSAR